MQFFKDFLLVVTSLTDQQQKKQLSERIAFVIFTITFLQRLSLLFPYDGYNLNIYEDVFLYLIYRFVSPFDVASILQIWGDTSLIYIVVTLIALVNLFMILTLISLTILYRLELYDPLNPKEILLIVSTTVYKYIMYLEYTLYIPMVSILLGSINCDIMANQTMCPLSFTYGMVIFALGSLITMTFITVFFFRTYKYWPENIIKKKFSYVAFWMPVINFIHIYLNNLGGQNFNNAIKLVFANMMGIIWFYELYLVSPYIPNLNSLMLYYALLYEVITIIVSLGVGSGFQIISQENLCVYFIFYGSLVLFLYTTIKHHQELLLIKRKNLNQFETIALIQLMTHKQKSMANNTDNKTSSRDMIMWYYTLVNHYQLCTQGKCKEKGNVLFQNRNKDIHQITKSFAECVLISQLNIMKKQKNCFYETLELFYISFQNDECNESLPAFCQLKLYQQRTEIHSFQFQCMKDSLNLQLKNKIIQRQKSFQKLLSNDISDKQLTTAQIYQSDQLREKYISQFQGIIDLKISYWVSLINGYNDIADYSRQVIKLSITLNSIKVQLEKDLRLNLNETFKPNSDTNVLILKILSIYFALAINDYEYCLQCEDQIEEILRSELSFSTDLVFNANIIKDQVILLSISTMKNRGQLIYKNKLQISKYFGFNEIKDFDNIKHVGQLMPDFVKEIHDSILANFLAKGSSDRFVKPKMLFLKDCNGFLFPANQKIQNFFEQSDDYVLTAEFNKVREFNDFILFDSSGQILGITKNLFALFNRGKEGSNINSNLNLEKLLNGYIFLLIPNIISLIHKHVTQLNMSETDVYQLEEQTYLNIPKNFLKMCDEFHSYYSTHKLHTATRSKIQKLFQTQFKTKFNYSESSRTVDPAVGNQSHGSDTLIQNCQVPLLNKDYNEIVEDFFSQVRTIEQKEDQTQYIIRNILEFRKIGVDENNFAFFFLEITDIKSGSNDILQTTTMNDSHYQDHSNLSYLKADDEINRVLMIEPVSRQLHYEFKDDHKNKQADQIFNEDFKIIDLSEIQDSKEIHLQEVQGIESARFSNLMEPISKRHTFVQPQNQLSQIMMLEDYNNIEQDFQNLKENPILNINSSQSRGGINQSNQELVGDVSKRVQQLYNIKESVEEFELHNLDAQHHSSKKIENSHQIQNVIKRHRRDIIYNEPEVGQSNSSRTSMTARRGTLDIIKGLRTRTKFNKDLQQLCYVYSTLVLFILISIIVSVVSNNTNATLLNNGIKNIVEPQRFSNQYFTIFTCGWLNLAQKMNIIGLSNYMQLQILNQTKHFQQNLNSDMLSRYQIFAPLEDEGKLDRLNIYYLDEPNIIKAKFSIFFFLILDKLNAIINLDFNKSQPEKQFVMDMVFLKENLGQIIKVNQDLITTISNVYNNDIIKIRSQVVSQFVIQLCLMSLLVLFPLILWKRFQITQQRILMFNSRVHQRSAQQMLLKFLVAKDIIQQNAKTKWKLFNYFDLMYRPIEETDYTSLQMDLRQYQAIIYPEKSSKNKSSNNHNSKSTLLSSRIRQTNVRGTTEILISLLILIITLMQLVGGYVLLVNQEQKRAPSENLVLLQVKYQNQFDTFMITGMLAKTTFLYYPLFFERNYFTINKQEVLKNIKLNTTDFIIDDFVTSFTYSQTQLINIWKTILGDTLLQDQAKITMLNLFQNSLCIDLYDSIPFCRIKQMGSQFVQQYGIYNQTDDDSRFVNTGLIDIVSGIFKDVKQDFNYEVQNHSYQQNATILQEYMNSDEFFNVFVAYFQDYAEAFTTIQEMIVFQIEFILFSGSYAAQLYYLVSGFSVLILISIFSGVWLERKNQIIHSLRMGITNIPIEVLFEPQMMVMLKQLDRE